MEANAALDLLERDGTLGSQVAVPGLSRAFFDRVYELFSSDSKRAEALAEKWRVVLSVGDEPDFTYRAKGLGEWLRGNWQQAAKSFLEAGRLQSDGSWTFALPAIDALGRAGDVKGAVATGERLKRRLRGNSVDLARLKVNLGNVYEQADHLERALRNYSEAARDLAPSLEHEQDLAKALTGEAACAWQLGRVGDAKASGDRARSIFEKLGQQVNVDICEGNLAQLALIEGRVDEAVRTLNELRSRAEGPRVAWLAEQLGFAYRCLNLIPEAVDCFEEALARGGMQASGRANVRMGLGLSLLDLGQTRSAQEHLRAAKGIYSRMGNRLMPALIDLESAKHEMSVGRYSIARRLATRASLALDSQRAEMSALHAASLAAEANFRLGGNMADISGLTRRLVRSGDSNLIWKGRYLSALTARTSRPHYRKMLDALLESRLLLSSPLSRAAFWGDKRRAIDSYLALLLSSGKRADIEEALNVVSRIRSATLIDEILGSAAGFSERQRAALAELRGQLNLLSEADGVPPHLRFSTRAARVGRAISRRWHEAAREVLTGRVASADLRRAPRCAAVVAVEGDYRVLTPSGETIPLGDTIANVERQAAIFRFECMEPLIDVKAGSEYCMAALRDLHRTCYEPWLHAQLCEICPEDGLWSIPWQAFPLLSGQTEELALRLTPIVARRDCAPKCEGGVAIWIGASASLPNIARERDLLRERFPDAIVCQSREEVLRLMAGQAVELVHVSAHGRHQDGNPMFSYIDFEDGPLYAAEIAGLDFHTERAVLLSCESGRVSIPFRREPDGLARAFLARGAEEVVGSSWLLDDDAAFALFDALYANSNRGPFANGLAEARRALFDRYRHPFYWAGPVLIRGYGMPGGS